MISRFEASNDNDGSKGLREGDIWKADSREEEEGGFVIDGMEIVRQANVEQRKDDNDRDKVNQEEGLSKDIEESEGWGRCTGEEGVRNGMGGEASNPPGKENGGYRESATGGEREHSPMPNDTTPPPRPPPGHGWPPHPPPLID